MVQEHAMMRGRDVLKLFFQDYKRQHNVDVKVIRILILMVQECKSMMVEWFLIL